MCFGDILKYLLIGAGTAAVACLVVGVAVVITQEVIKRRAKEKYRQAKFAFVKQIKNARKVKIGVFDDYSNELGEMEIESDKGVSNDVRVGQKIYM